MTLRLLLLKMAMMTAGRCLWPLFRVGGHGKLDRSRLGGIPVGFSGGLANDSNIKILQQHVEKTDHVSTLNNNINNKNCDPVVPILAGFPDFSYLLVLNTVVRK